MFKLATLPVQTPRVRVAPPRYAYCDNCSERVTPSGVQNPDGLTLVKCPCGYQGYAAVSAE